MPESKLKEQSAKRKTQKRPVKTTVAAAKPVAQRTKKTGLTVDVVDTAGKVVESFGLPAEIFGAKVNKKLMAQAVRVYLANQRQGTVSTKTRGEVAGSTRKIYRQKGTGRARHGSVRAPIFVHGGLVFGPKPRDFSLNFPKRMKKAALASALSAKLADGQVRVVAGLEKLEPKTKAMVAVFEKLSLPEKNAKVVIVVDQTKDSVVRAVRNIEGVMYTAASRLTTYDVMNHNAVVFMKETIADLEKRFAEGKTS